MNPEEVFRDEPNAKEPAQIKIRVRLEPELESEVALMRPFERRRMADKLERWVRQLRVSAFIIERDEARPVPKFKPLPKAKLAKN